LDIIGRIEAFSENGFQVSGVRFQAGSHFFTTDTFYETSSGYGKIKVGPTPLARHTQGV
jgi:hypothetical protein